MYRKRERGRERAFVFSDFSFHNINLKERICSLYFIVYNFRQLKRNVCSSISNSRETFPTLSRTAGLSEVMPSFQSPSAFQRLIVWLELFHRCFIQCCFSFAVPPDILSTGTSDGEVSVLEGENATLSCKASGRPPPRVFWRREKSEYILMRGVHDPLMPSKRYRLYTLTRDYHSQHHLRNSYSLCKGDTPHRTKYALFQNKICLSLFPH